MKWLDKFNLTATEKKGFIVLAVLIFVALLVRIAVLFYPNNPELKQSRLLDDLEQWEVNKRESLRVQHRFNPNTVSDEFIDSLKISAYAKKNWRNYLAKNRLFKEPEDVLKIYGMDTLWYEVNKDSIYITEKLPAKESVLRVELFEFDPNQVTPTDLKKLGFPDWVANRLLNYRKSGGMFKKPKDLLNLYDFPADLYEEIEDYIKIAPIKAEKEIEKIAVSVNINSADSVELLSIVGVGPTFASRIIAYRNRLGGYYKTEQLKEIYGIDDQKYQDLLPQIFVGAQNVKTININTATFKVLLHHPYLNYEQVKVIVNYREMFKEIKSIDDLKNLEGITAKDVERLKPYLRVE